MGTLALGANSKRPKSHALFGAAFKLCLMAHYTHPPAALAQRYSVQRITHTVVPLLRRQRALALDLQQNLRCNCISVHGLVSASSTILAPGLVRIVLDLRQDLQGSLRVV